jgi:hypothetical protein
VPRRFKEEAAGFHRSEHQLPYLLFVLYSLPLHALSRANRRVSVAWSASAVLPDRRWLRHDRDRAQPLARSSRVRPNQGRSGAAAKSGATSRCVTGVSARIHGYVPAPAGRKGRMALGLRGRAYLVTRRPEPFGRL